VKITDVPVINPDFVADVKWSPIVCEAKHVKYRRPSNIPPLIAGASNFLSEPNTNGRRRIAATENRNEINNIGEIEPSAVLIIANVPPQITVVIKRADSALYFFIIS
jgi:hypothetical protein